MSPLRRGETDKFKTVENEQFLEQKKKNENKWEEIKQIVS